MGTRTRIGIWVVLTVVLGFLAWGLGPLLFGGGIGPELDEPVAVVDGGGEDAPLEEEKAEGLSDAEREREDEEFMAWMEEEAALADEAQDSMAEDGEDYVAEVVEAEPVASGEGGPSGGSGDASGLVKKTFDDLFK